MIQAIKNWWNSYTWVKTEKGYCKPTNGEIKP